MLPALKGARPGHLVTYFNWGQYALWHLGPALKVSMDGRRETVYSDRRLAEHRLVTLVGPGGVGKSRLALEAAHHWLEIWGSEVWIVELAAIDRNDDVVPAILRALELPEVGDGRADGRRVFDYLSTRKALLVLDNCEHVIGDVARVAQDLLESCAERHEAALVDWHTDATGLAPDGYHMGAAGAGPYAALIAGAL